MGMRSRKREELLRLESKTLDAQFRVILQQGLNCSAFEAEAVIDAVKEVYFPHLDTSQWTGPPGKISLVAVCADEPAGKAVADCCKRNVCLTVHRGTEDDRILQSQGAEGFRQARIADLCQEALSQGALLTRGETVRVLRHGKVIAQIVPASTRSRAPSWKGPGLRLQIKGRPLSSAIIEERRRRE